MRKLAAATVVFVGVVGIIAAVALSRPDDAETPAVPAATATPAAPSDGLADPVDFERLLDERSALGDPKLFEVADQVLET